MQKVSFSWLSALYTHRSSAFSAGSVLVDPITCCTCRWGLSLRCSCWGWSSFTSQEGWAQGQYASWFLYFLMLSLFLADTTVSLLDLCKCMLWSCQFIWEVDVTGEISIPKVAEVNFLCPCEYTHARTHTQPQNVLPLQTQTSFSCTFPPFFAHFGFGGSRETLWVLLKRWFWCLMEAIISSFCFVNEYQVEKCSCCSYGVSQPGHCWMGELRSTGWPCQHHRVVKPPYP